MADPNETITMTVKQYRADLQWAAEVCGPIAVQTASLRDTTRRLRESMREDG